MQFTGENIKELRKKKGDEEGRKITQEVMATEIDVPRSTIATWEKSGVKKRGDVLLLCNYFKITVDGNDDDDTSSNQTIISKMKEKLAQLIQTDWDKAKNVMVAFDEALKKDKELNEELRKINTQLDDILKSKD